ncbi:MAG: hypothetical protein Q8M15_08340 [Bacteroidota bacterium]|nr:hypothetical protein [Bacteroidota bacterium]
MKTEKQNKYNEDEFDIELLSWKLYKLSGKIISKLFFPLRLILSRPLRLILLFCIITGLAIILRYTLPKVYQSSFIIKPLARGDVYFVSLVHDLSIITRDEDYGMLAKQLNISDEMASKISKISLEPIKLNKYTDTIDAAFIFIRCDDLLLFDTLQQSVLNYLEQNEYYLKKRQLRSVEILAMKDKIELDLKEIDSLKILLAKNMQPRGNAGGFVFGEPIDPVKIYEEGLSLYKLKTGLNWQLQYLNSFELVKKCMPSHKPYWPRFIYLFVILGGLGLIGLMWVNYTRK